MTREDIIRMAQEAGVRMDYIFDAGTTRWILQPGLIRFAALVAEAEREACAKVCDEKAKRNFPWSSVNADRYHAQADWAYVCAKAIRARGSK
jgi:hypothetical protein